MPDRRQPTYATEYEIAWVLDQTNRTPGFPSCTFTGIDRLPLLYLSRKKDGNILGAMESVQEFFSISEREEVRFRNPAVVITTCKNSKNCFASISELFSQSSWNAKSSLGNVRKERSTGSRTRIADCNSLILSMHRIFHGSRRQSAKCSML